MEACTLVRNARLVGVALADPVVRRRHAATLPMGRLDPMGNEGARLVRAWPYRAVRAQRPVVRSRWDRMVRCCSELSGDGSALAGLDECDARPLGRFADERPMVAARR